MDDTNQSESETPANSQGIIMMANNSQETTSSPGPGGEVFTTEIFKIEIGNLPKMYSINVGLIEKHL